MWLQDADKLIHGAILNRVYVHGWVAKNSKRSVYISRGGQPVPSKWLYQRNVYIYNNNIPLKQPLQPFAAGLSLPQSTGKNVQWSPLAFGYLSDFRLFVSHCLLNGQFSSEKSSDLFKRALLYILVHTRPPGWALEPSYTSAARRMREFCYLCLSERKDESTVPLSYD